MAKTAMPETRKAARTRFQEKTERALNFSLDLSIVATDDIADLIAVSFLMVDFCIEGVLLFDATEDTLTREGSSVGMGTGFLTETEMLVRLETGIFLAGEPLDMSGRRTY